MVNRKKTIYHRDGTITYWSVYEQVWNRRTGYVPDAELVAMGSAERSRVCAHLDKMRLGGYGKEEK